MVNVRYRVMARSGVTEQNLYAFMMSAGAAERVARYRQEAEKFRQMAAGEAEGALKESLKTIAREYDELADTLTPPDA